MAGPFLWAGRVAAQVAIPESRQSKSAIKRRKAAVTRDMEALGFDYGDQVFLRIVKTAAGQREGAYLEAFVEKDDRFKPFKRWPVCYYSGELGPKLKQGDRQSPEGFYWVPPRALNPFSSYHLSFNLGYPNAYDRYHGRTGNYLMVHGQCVSIGCYAMGDEAIEEIFTLMVGAYKAGQRGIRVHIFPFEMDEDLSKAQLRSPHGEFWKNLKQGWDHFQRYARPPNVEVSGGKYVFDDSF